MTKRAIAAIVVAGALLLGTVATGWLLHSLLHLEWRIVTIVCILALAFAAVAVLGAFQQARQRRQRPRAQRIAYLCSPFVFVLLGYVGWSCGYPRTIGTVGFAVFAATYIYYHLGPGIPGPEKGQSAESEEKPDAPAHDGLTD